MRHKHDRWPIRDGCFCIKRDVSVDSYQSFRFIGNITEEFWQSYIRPRQLGYLAVTLLESGDTINARKGSRSLAGMSVKGILDCATRPCIGTEEQRLDVSVSGVGLLGMDVFEKSLVVYLDDDEGLLRNEAYTYRNRLSLSYKDKEFIPHISIAKIDISDTTSQTISEMYDWVKVRVPDIVTLNPSRSVTYEDDNHYTRTKKTTVKRRSNGRGRRAS